MSDNDQLPEVQVIRLGSGGYELYCHDDDCGSIQKSAGVPFYAAHEATQARIAHRLRHAARAAKVRAKARKEQPMTTKDETHCCDGYPPAITPLDMNRPDYERCYCASSSDDYGVHCSLCTEAGCHQEDKMRATKDETEERDTSMQCVCGRWWEQPRGTVMLSSGEYRQEQDERASLRAELGRYERLTEDIASLAWGDCAKGNSVKGCGDKRCGNIMRIRSLIADFKRDQTG